MNFFNVIGLLLVIHTIDHAQAAGLEKPIAPSADIQQDDNSIQGCNGGTGCLFPNNCNQCKKSIIVMESMYVAPVEVEGVVSVQDTNCDCFKRNS
eukprot:Pgem_evm1s5648